MTIVVLVKQVPEIALIQVDSASNQVVLPQGPGIVNPFDEYAVEEGLRLKERTGGRCVIMTVGSERADAALRDCLALGADDAYLLSDPLFSGADSQTTARILAAGLKKLGDATVIIAGKQAVDSDSSQVPSAVAALLDLPQAMFVKKVESIGASEAVVHRSTEDGYDVVQLQLPAVISVVKEINEPRLPSLKGKMAAKKKEITTWTAADVALTQAALASNLTVVSVAPPPTRPSGKMIEGATPDEIADKLFRRLREQQVI